MTTAQPSRDFLSERLPGALERGELSLCYRPQLCLASGRVGGAEVALTWSIPTVGEVPADAFLPLIETLGLGESLCRWALQTACSQAVAWQQDGVPVERICIESWASPRIERGLCSMVKAVLGKTSLPAHCLAIGFSARALERDGLTAADTLRELRAAGVETMATGFGAGLCDLSALGQLPLDLVKIDASMSQSNAPSGTVARALIQFAHGMQWRVLLDSVDSEEQLQALTGQGGDFAQGHQIGGALPPAEFQAMLERGLVAAPDAILSQDRQRTLLLVDDEENILSALKRLFRRDGYRVLTASSGIQGLEVLAENHVDVILSDQRMPGMAGVDFLRHAKDLYPNTIRMTLSGYTDLQSIIDAVNEGAVYKFLTKPWEDERLRDHVALAFRQCELAEENMRLGQAVHAINSELASANQRLERMVAVEHERRRAMQAAAGASRDMLDLLPIAVFGVGAEGMLAYANRCAIRDWPLWASAIGDEPEPQLMELMAALDETPQTDGKTDRGLDLGLEGRQVTAWKRTLAGVQDDLGALLILHESKPVRQCEMETSS